VVCAKNRFPHPFSAFTFVETIQVIRFHKGYKLWKSRLPHRLFSLRVFDFLQGEAKTNPTQPKGYAT